MTWGRDTDEHDARDQLQASATPAELWSTPPMSMSTALLSGFSVSLLGRRRPDAVMSSSPPKPASRPGTPRRFDASRGYLLSALDDSLDRLGTDYVDLWQFHAWDPRTPIDETLSAADEAVRSGRARYVGISNYSGWQTAWACAWQIGLSGSCATGGEPDGVLACCNGESNARCSQLLAHTSAGLIAWSPLGRGVLTGKYRTGTPSDSRAASEHFADFVRPFLDDRSRKIVDAVLTAASAASAWPPRGGPRVGTRPTGSDVGVVGARTAAQLLGSLAAETWTCPTRS